MKLKSFQDQTDSILININEVVLRCDLHHRYIDHLYLQRHTHQRVLKSKPLQDIQNYDLESLFQRTHLLISDFKVSGYHIANIYRHDRNDRFVLMECTQGLRLELDKELNGIKDRSKRSYSNMYKRRPDNYYKASVVKEYHRIYQDIVRTFEQATRIIHLKYNRS
jgi:hypothetical protein